MAELLEYGERAETYAQWSARWGIAREEFSAEALRVASELEEMVNGSAIPDGKVDESLGLIAKYRELAPQDRIRFWHDHLSSLDADERDEFYRQSKDGRTWPA
ncbi:hypothetical protein [Arthrobacter alpinus]|nr:hypothetical protein [Arthrobacter alpinus]